MAGLCWIGKRIRPVMWEPSIFAGLITTLLEMCFANTEGGMEINLDKKLRQQDEKLARRHVCLHLTPEAHEWLLKEGFKPEYGARG